MTPSARCGLEVAIDRLDERARDIAYRHQLANLRAAIAWIKQQLAIDTRRRQPRGKYIGKPR